MQIRLPTYNHCRINRDREMFCPGAAEEGNKGSEGGRRGGAIRDRSPAGTESKRHTD